jgi:hypothetical protein
MSIQSEPDVTRLGEWLSTPNFLAAYSAEVQPLRRKLISFPADGGREAISRPLIDPDDLVKSKRKELNTLDSIARRAELRLMVRRHPDLGGLMYRFFDECGALMLEAEPTSRDLTQWLRSRIESALIARGCSQALPGAPAHRL